MPTSAPYVQPQAYDAAGKPVAFSPDAHFEKGARVYAKDPYNKLVTVPVEEARTPGYTVLSPEALHKAYVEKQYGTSGGVGNIAGTVAAGLPRLATLGLSDKVAVALGGEDTRRALEGYKESNPNLNAASEIAGGVGAAIAAEALTGGAATPFLEQSLGGLAARAALTPMRAASTLGKLAEGAVGGSGVMGAAAGMAARGAVEAAAMGAGSELSRATLEDVPLTAERLLAGAWDGAKMGGAFGAGAGVISSTVGKVGRKVLARLADEFPEPPPVALAASAKSTPLTFEEALARSESSLSRDSALSRYSEHAGGVNGNLWNAGRRAGVGIHPEAAARKAAILDEMAIARDAGAAFDGPVYRGVKLTDAELEHFTSPVNGVVDVPAFTSTSVDRSVALDYMTRARAAKQRNPVLFEIDQSGGVPVPHHSDAMAREVVLEPGKFRLERATKNADGVWEVRLSNRDGHRFRYPPPPEPSAVAPPVQKAPPPPREPLLSQEMLQQAGTGALVGILTGHPLTGVVTSAGISLAKRLIQERGAEAMATLADRVSTVAGRVELAGKVAALAEAPKALAAPAAMATSKAFKHYSQVVDRAKADPGQFIQQVGQATADLSVHHPDVAMQVTETLMGDLAYLDSIHPKPPSNTSTLTPIAVQTEYTFSYDQQKAFADAAMALDNPLGVFNDIARGNLPLDAINALKARRPALFGDMRQAVIKHTMTRTKELPFNRRMLLGVAFDFTSDWSIANTAAIQASLQPPAPESPNNPHAAPSKINDDPGADIAPGGF